MMHQLTNSVLCHGLGRRVLFGWADGEPGQVRAMKHKTPSPILFTHVNICRLFTTPALDECWRVTPVCFWNADRS
jgi:hypothetical protein